MKKIVLCCSLIISLVFCISCSEHKHKYGEWVIDEDGHYRSLICDECNQPAVVDPHIDLNDDNKCDECSYYMGEEHAFKWVGTPEGHHKNPLCGCCDYLEEVYPHSDNDKDNICDSCKYSMIDINISWLYTETHHWYQYGDEAVAYEYDVHIDENNDFICDVCDFLITAHQTDVPKTSWMFEDGTVLFSYEFSIGDTYRFDDRKIYVNDNLVYTLEDSCKHHYYEYFIGLNKVTTGTYEEFIEKFTVKKVLIEYYIEAYNYNPYNKLPARLPFNCEYAELGMDIIKPGNYSTHKCIGVYFDENFTMEINDTFDLLELENKVLYVKWEETPITITLDLNSDVTDGIEAELDRVDKVIEKRYSENITLPVPSISGFEFIGWYDDTKRITDNSGQIFWDINILDDINLKAKWIRTEYYFNVKEKMIDNVLTKVLEVGDGPNRTEYLIPENAISGNSLAVLFVKDVMEELHFEALFSGNIHADYFNPGHHLEFFTSVFNDENTRKYFIDLEDIDNGFYLCPYYSVNEYNLHIYNGETFVDITTDYEILFNKYISSEPLFEVNLEKEGYFLLGVHTADGKYILDPYNRLLSDGLECLELRFNNLDAVAKYIKK